MAIGKTLRRFFNGSPPASPTPPAPPVDEVQALRDSLKGTIRTVNAAAGRLPPSVVPEVHRVEDVLHELLNHAQRSAGNALGALEMQSLEAAVTDYLPTSIETFLALPVEFVAEHRNNKGQSPGQELSEQLMFLEHGVRELAQAVYSGDANQLSTQGRFLKTKFSRSDLDLP